MSLLFARNRGFGGGNREVVQFMTDSHKVIRAILTVSRLNYKPEPLNFKLAAEPIAELKGESLDLETLCEKRALALLEDFRGSGLSRLNVMWSGGIDSTLAILSLLRYWPPKEREALGVVLTAESVAEYPWLWYGTLRKAIRHIENGADRPYDRIMDDALLVTGELGDQVCGSDIMQEVIRLLGLDALWCRDYQKTMVNKITRQTGDAGVANRFFSLFEPIVNECPIPIENTVDFLWWFNFSQKWQYVKYRCAIFSSEDKVERNVARTYHFYDCEDFQRWAIEHHKENFPTHWLDYKTPFKEQIVKWTGNTEYRKKTKVQSLSWMMDYHEAALGMTDDYRYVDSLDQCAREGWAYGN